MSKYTTDLKNICEKYSGLTDRDELDDVERVIDLARSRVFSFDYPIYQSDYKPVLEKKILRRYYFREIGEETVGLWRARLSSRLNEIMPYYNQLYETAELSYDPFKDVDYTVEHRGSGEGSRQDSANRQSTQTINDRTTGTSSRQSDYTRTDNLTETTTGQNSSTTSGESTDEAWTLKSDTPQGSIQNLDDNTYLSEATKATDEAASETTTTGSESGTRANTGSVRNAGSESGSESGTQTGTHTDSGTSSAQSSYTNTDNYLEHVYGIRGGATYMSLIKELRETLLNIDQMIINDLADLFMGVW